MAQMTLLILGVALIVFGAFVLLRHSDRPGGTIKALGAEVSSSGAGLPLIALGAGLIAFAATRMNDTPPVAVPVTAAAPAGTTGDTSCIAGMNKDVPRDRIQPAELGAQAVEILGPHQKLDSAPFVVLLTENGIRLGAVRMTLYLAGSSDPVFKIAEGWDAACSPVTEMKNVSRGGDPRVLVNWDSWRAKIGARSYELRVGTDKSVSVTLTAVQ